MKFNSLNEIQLATMSFAFTFFSRYKFALIVDIKFQSILAISTERKKHWFSFSLGHH